MSLALFLWQQSEVYVIPSFFAPVLMTLLVGGLFGWTIAAFLGFSRARRVHASFRWFALSAVCMILFHLHLLLLAVGAVRKDANLTLSIGAFFNVFVVLGAIFAIIGFVRASDV